MLHILGRTYHIAPVGIQAVIQVQAKQEPSRARRPRAWAASRDQANRVSPRLV